MTTKIPHKHHDLTVAWAKGNKIKYRRNHDNIWVNISRPSWDIESVYRIKPEPEYPLSSLTKDRLEAIGSITGGEYLNTYFAIANAAVKQYMIDNGIEPKEI